MSTIEILPSGDGDLPMLYFYRH